MDILNRTKVTMMLADHAQVANGKLFISGGGWTVIGPGPVPFAIALTIELPWDAAGVEHKSRLDFLDDQGPVEVPMPDGSTQPVLIQGSFPLAPAPGIKRGSPLTVPIAINVSPPPPLQSDWRYEWRFELDGETHEDWRLGFVTLPLAQSKAA
jgi:hypothetical protein